MPDLSVPDRPLRIAVLHFAHETVTFLASDTTIADFTYQGSPAGGAALLGFDPEGYIGGFVQVAREHAGVELVGITSPLGSRRGTGSGWITTETFDHFAGIMTEELARLGPFDGVYMALHGAMGVCGVPRPEAELARRVRAAVGPAARIAATFDPHGNEDASFFEAADLAFTVKYFPHYDMHLQGERAARMLIRTLRGSYAPRRAVVEVPIISPTVLQWTGASPWMDLIQRALVWEARKVDAYVNVFFGFPWSDVPDVGLTIQATTNGDAALAETIARDMAATAWRLRERLLHSAEVLSMDQGVTRAREAVAAGAKPVVLADHSDRSGAATWLLAELIRQDAANALIATIADADITAALAQAKPGDAFDHAIGGRLDESAGPPVRVRGRIARVTSGTDMPHQKSVGETWLQVEFGRGNLLVISPHLVQVMEPHTLAALGIDPATFDIIAIKSRVHFRRGFDDTGFAPSIFLVQPDQPFLGTTRLEGLPYRHVDLARYYPYVNPDFTP